MTNIDDQINNRKTCKDRIEDNLRDREEYLNGLKEAIENDSEYDGYDYPQDLVHEYALGYSVTRVIEIQISTGGPGDWLEVFVDDEGSYPEIVKIKYHFSDWFDHAEMTVSTDSPFYWYAEQIVDFLSN